MYDYQVSVRKLTDEDLARSACEMTFNGTSKQTLDSIYRSEHSPARTQLFWITCTNIPLFVSTHLLRHHVGSVPFQLTCRQDRKGGNPRLHDLIKKIIEHSETITDKAELKSYLTEELDWIANNTDRYTPVNLGLMVNAQSLIDMAKLRICLQAAEETREVFALIKKAVAAVDPALARLMVRKCVYRGGICGEPKCCGFNHSLKFKREIEEYLENFSSLQIGGCIKDSGYERK